MVTRSGDGFDAVNVSEHATFVSKFQCLVVVGNLGLVERDERCATKG